MSLVILGQSGGPTELSANDDVFGLMTQVPENAVRHSPAGVEDADGNTAFGTPFTLLAYMTHSTTYAKQTTTVTFTSDALPYKMRVLGAKIRCIACKTLEHRQGYGFVQMQVQDSDGAGVWTSIAGDDLLGDMNPGDSKDVACLDERYVELSASDGLRVAFSSSADSFGKNPTASFLVELQCIRVV